MPPKINSEAQSKYPTVSNEKKKSFKAQNIKTQPQQNTNPSKEEKGKGKAKANVPQEQIIAQPKRPTTQEKGKAKAKIQPEHVYKLLPKPPTNTNDIIITPNNSKKQKTKQEPTVIDATQWYFTPLRVYYKKHKYYYNINILKLLLEINFPAHPIHIINLDEINETNPFNVKLITAPDPLKYTINDSIVVLTTHSNATEYQTKALFFKTSPEGYNVYYKDPTGNSIPQVLSNEFKKHKEIVQIHDLFQRDLVNRDDHTAQYVVDYFDKFVSGDYNLYKYTEEYVIDLRKRHEIIFTNHKIFDTVTLWKYLEDYKHLIVNKKNIRIEDLENPELNNRDLVKKGNHRNYAKYTLAEVIILLAYRISIYNKSQQTDLIRIMVLPIDSTYRSYQFNEMMALKDIYNIVGVIHTKKNEYVAFYIKKETQDFIYCDPLNNDPIDEIQQQCNINKLHLNVNKKQYQYDDDSNGTWTVYLLDQLYSETHLDKTVTKKDKNYDSFVQRRRGGDNKIINENLHVSVNNYYKIIETHVLPLIIQNKDHETYYNSDESKSPEETENDIQETEDILPIIQQKHEAKAPRVPLRLHGPREPRVIQQQVQQGTQGPQVPQVPQGQQEQQVQEVEILIEKSTQTGQDHLPETIAFYDTYKECIQKQRNNVFFQKRKAPFIFTDIDIDASFHNMIPNNNNNNNNNFKTYARDFIDNEGYAFVRCNIKTFLQYKINEHIFKKVKRGKYSLKLKYFCLLLDDDFDKWNNYYVVKPDKIIKTQTILEQVRKINQENNKKDCINFPVSHHKQYTYIPIVKWQYKDILKNIYVKRVINNGSDKMGLSQPSLTRNIQENIHNHILTVGFK